MFTQTYIQNSSGLLSQMLLLDQLFPTSRWFHRPRTAMKEPAFPELDQHPHPNLLRFLKDKTISPKSASRKERKEEKTSFLLHQHLFIVSLSLSFSLSLSLSHPLPLPFSLSCSSLLSLSLLFLTLNFLKHTFNTSSQMCQIPC